MRTIKIGKKKFKTADLLLGACMEDVNHELYGGIYSQMIFGEAFEEPAKTGYSAEGISVFGHTWRKTEGGISCGREADGPKVIFENCVCGERCRTEMTVSADGLAGFILRADNAKHGADSFCGYEVAVGDGIVRLAKHNNNYVNLKDVECDTARGEAVRLSATVDGVHITVAVNGKQYIDYTDDTPIAGGKIGLRAWNTDAEFSDITLNGELFDIPDADITPDISGMWMQYGKRGDFTLADRGYRGANRQIVKNGGIYNRGLNRSGMYFAGDKDYRGFVYAKADEKAVVTVSLCNSDCSVKYTSEKFEVCGEWAKYGFTLVSDTEEYDGCFLIEADGEAAFGYAFLETGEWGLYKGMHARRDVGEGLENMGIGFLRFGGCMVNIDGYRIREMLGLPENRRPYRGFWYPYSSLGFSILEYIELCEKMNIDAIPDFHGYETAEDMRDFVKYALGTDENDEYVRLRLASHHPEPYRLKYIQFGNEEKVTEDFADRFIAAANAVWSVCPDITMIVGDFTYENHTFDDPYDIPPECTASKIKTLAPHKRIIENAVSKGLDDKLWFDIHWWSEHGDTPAGYIKPAKAFHEHLMNMVPGNRSKICVLELNANAHDFERGMANAYAIISAINMCDILPCVSSANCLQVDHQNDNSWDQGLLFMNNHSVWYQAAGCLDIMLRHTLKENVLAVNDEDSDPMFSYAATGDEKTISVCVVNRGDEDEETVIELPEGENSEECKVTVMSYPKNAANTAENRNYIKVPDAERIIISDSKMIIKGNSIATLEFCI